MREVEYLRSEDAALYLGFTTKEGKPNLAAFKTWRWRFKPKTYKLAGRLRFRRVDLDRCIEAVR